MPSFAVHLAIATIYLSRNPQENKDEFIRGSIEVDITNNTDKAHYTGNPDKSVLSHYLKEKVNLKRFVEENKISTSYDRGYFLHLLGDYLFYNFYFSSDYIKKTSYHDFKRDLYHDWPIYNDYLKEKYHFEIPKKVDLFLPSKQKPILLEKEKLNDFITEVGMIPLDRVYSLIKRKTK